MADRVCNLRTTYDAEQKIWSGVSEQDLYNDDLTIGQIIFRQLHSDPKRLCQISHNEKTRLTRAEMRLNSAKVSVYLRQQGFTTETDIVGVIARNTTHVASIAYGCMFNGTIFHAISPIIDEQTIIHLFGITKPKLIFCDVEDYEKLQKIGKILGVKLLTINGGLDGVTSMLNVLQTEVPEDFQPQSYEKGIDRTMAILSSSGTTGTPKAVTVSNSRNIFDVESYLTPSDVQYTPSTLDWLSGVMTLVTSGVYGTVRLIFNEPFSPVNFMQMCEQHGITWCVLAASHIAMLVNNPAINARQLKSLRHVFFAGGRTLVSTLDKIQSYLSHVGILRNAYGLSELGTCVALNYYVDTKPTSVGHIVNNYKVRVVDESGNYLGPNQVGDIHCRSKDHWNGYYGNPTATAEIQDSDGWFHTGDLGYFDDDNYLYIVERKKDMLKYVGMMYFPHEVEEVIAKMPEVAEVCVFGIWNETEGDAAAASVVPKPGSHLSPSQIKEFVVKNIPASFKHLHGGVQCVPQLAKLANGKVNRKAVRDAFLAAANQTKNN